MFDCVYQNHNLYIDNASQFSIQFNAYFIVGLAIEYLVCTHLNLQRRLIRAQRSYINIGINLDTHKYVLIFLLCAA